MQNRTCMCWIRCWTFILQSMKMCLWEPEFSQAVNLLCLHGESGEKKNASVGTSVLSCYHGVDNNINLIYFVFIHIDSLHKIYIEMLVSDSSFVILCFWDWDITPDTISEYYPAKSALCDRRVLRLMGKACFRFQFCDIVFMSFQTVVQFTRPADTLRVLWLMRVLRTIKFHAILYWRL